MELYGARPEPLQQTRRLPTAPAELCGRGAWGRGCERRHASAAASPGGEDCATGDQTLPTYCTAPATPCALTRTRFRAPPPPSPASVGAASGSAASSAIQPGTLRQRASRRAAYAAALKRGEARLAHCRRRGGSTRRAGGAGASRRGRQAHAREERGRRPSAAGGEEEARWRGRAVTRPPPKHERQPASLLLALLLALLLSLALALAASEALRQHACHSNHLEAEAAGTRTGGALRAPCSTSPRKRRSRPSLGRTRKALAWRRTRAPRHPRAGRRAASLGPGVGSPLPPRRPTRRRASAW